MAGVNMESIAAEMELLGTTELVNNLVGTCMDKCINTKYKEGDLSKAEAVCADRCVAKFLEVHNFVGKKMNDMQQAAMNAQQQPQ